MRLWLSRKSPVSMREQISTQVMLGVISEDLKPGQRVPSVRELARSHKIHANTVSAAYRDLVRRGWLETRRGSGVYVRRLAPVAVTGSALDALIEAFLAEARSKGFSSDAVLARLAGRHGANPVRRVVVAEPEPELGQVLCEEIRHSTAIPVSAVLLDGKLPPSMFQDAAVAALVSRARPLEMLAPPGVPRVLLKLHSVASALTGQQRPAPDAIVTVVSHSPELLRWTRTVLLAAARAGLEAWPATERDGNHRHRDGAAPATRLASARAAGDRGVVARRVAPLGQFPGLVTLAKSVTSRALR